MSARLLKIASVLVYLGRPHTPAASLMLSPALPNYLLKPLGISMQRLQ
jgi:hypothetical protein